MARVPATYCLISENLKNALRNSKLITDEETSYKVSSLKSLGFSKSHLYAMDEWGEGGEGPRKIVPNWQSKSTSASVPNCYPVPKVDFLSFDTSVGIR